MKRQKQILVVGNDSSLRTMLKRVLAGKGYRVRSAADGAAALQAAHAGPPDLVLLDLNLPAENGWDVFARLTRKWPLLPVAVISGVTSGPPHLHNAEMASLRVRASGPLRADSARPAIADAWPISPISTLQKCQ